MNQEQATRILMKSRLMSRNSPRSITVSSGSHRGCPGCGNKKTKQTINRFLNKSIRG